MIHPLVKKWKKQARKIGKEIYFDQHPCEMLIYCANELENYEKNKSNRLMKFNNIKWQRKKVK